MRILIAEDDPVSRLILQKHVEREGHDCFLAASGEEAWVLFQANVVDVIISDWVMPAMSGLDLCQMIRTDSSRGYTYFILLTSLDGKANRADGMLAGADDYLIKPLDREELRLRLLAAERVTSLHRQVLAQKIELEHLNRQLHRQGRRDALTGLRNRLCLREDLELMSDRSQRYGHTYGLAMVDIDHFKRYNDRYGHQAGDSTIRAVAEALVQGSRSGDTVYRYGGEEFLVLLAEARSMAIAAATMMRIGRLVQQLEIPHQESPHGVVTISVGVALCARDGTLDVQQMIAEADEALYAAKHSGRNTVAISKNGEAVVQTASSG